MTYSKSNKRENGDGRERIVDLDIYTWITMTYIYIYIHIHIHISLSLSLSLSPRFLSHNQSDGGELRVMKKIFSLSSHLM